MAQLVTRGRGATLTALCILWSVAAAAQQRDTTAPPHPADSLKVYTLPPAVVSVTRANPPINRIPQAVHLIERTEISRGRPTWGLDVNRNWSKWQSSTSFRVGSGSALVTVSWLDYTGQRQRSVADFRNLNSRWHFPLAPGWSLAAPADVGWDPRADNPGALTNNEMRVNRDSAARLNITQVAGKDVTQGQGGVTVRRELAGGGEASLTVFGITRRLKNPTTFAYIDLKRFDYGARFSVSRPVPLGSLEQRLTAGVDFQRQRDDRLNFNNVGGQPGSLRQLDQLEHVTEVGPFIQSALQLTPKVSVTGGIRYDWVNFQVNDRLVNDSNPDDSGGRLMRALSGSLGVAVTPSDGVTLYGNVGTSFETPTTTELTNRPRSAGGFNPGLQPQKATNYEIGLRGDVAGRLNYSVALYQADVRDELIGYQVPSSSGRVFFQNAGTSRHRGIEVGSELEIAAGLNLVTTWTYSDFRYTRYTLGTQVLDGQALPGIPQHWLHFLFQLRPPAVRGAWVEVEETHSSGFTVDDTASTSNAPRTGPWWSTNLRVGWEGTVGSVRLRPFVGFNNVWNRAYVGWVVINAANRRYYEPAPGRNVYVGFSLGAGE